MSWVHEPCPDDPVFARWCGPHGVDHILSVHGLFPEALEAHMVLYRTLMFGPNELTRAQREAIAVTVSEVNQCRY